ADVSTQAGKWEKSRFMGVELYAKTLGLIGAGNIGGIVADRALGRKMKVVAYDPFLSPERAVELGVEKVEPDELLARADIIALQVAEQISDYLLTGAVTNALNSPSVTAEEAPRLKPFIALAEKLGLMAGQMVDFGIKAIELAYEGEVAKLNAKPLTAAALAGV